MVPGVSINPYVLQVMCLAGINIILAVSLNLINGFTGQFSIGHAGFMAIGAYSSAFVTVTFGDRIRAGLS
ncbi:MAG TPA: branched-chain amino acid ABC transporter permease, partial [Thermoanaerobaculia bacterium]|nr:branched-chain amino acid ABC transporter permease [Thermoanaerobaculia bacterium]